MRNTLRAISVLLAAIILLCTVGCASSEPNEASDFRYDINRDGITITRYFGQRERIVIPSQIDGIAVTVIGEGAFEHSNWVVSVVIPDTVTAIEAGAFAGRTDLRRVTLGEGVTTIGEQAFSGCTALRDVSLPDGLVTIGESAFQGSGIRKAGIPASVQSIAVRAFADCGRLEEITVHEDNAVYKSVDGALYDIGVTRLYQYPGGKKSENFVLPDTVTAVGESAFFGSADLSGITLPEGLLTIGGWAFDECVSLARLHIPAGVTAIGDHAFSQCTGIEGITAAEENEHFRSQDGVLMSADMTSLIAYPRAARAESYTVPDGVERLCVEAFADNVFIKEIVLPDSVRVIEESCFNNCVELEKIKLPPQLGNIEMFTFHNCISLESIDIPASVEGIGHFAFGHCTALRQIQLHDGLDMISSFAFCHCRSLEEIYIPASVQYIESTAFHDCAEVMTVHKGSSAEIFALDRNREYVTV